MPQLSLQLHLQTRLAAYKQQVTNRTRSEVCSELIMELANLPPTTHHQRKKRKVLDVEVSVKEPNEGEKAPYVVRFPSGVDPISLISAVGDTGEPKLRFKAYGGPGAKTRHILVGEGEHVDYFGRSYGMESQNWNPCQYALGVFNRKTKTLELAPIAADKVFRLEPRVRGQLYGDDIFKQAHTVKEFEGPEEDRVKAEIAERILRKRQLVDAFGSKKSKRNALAIDRAYIHENFIGSAKAVENLVAEAANEEGAMTLAEAHERASKAERNVPPFDITAETPEEAYPLDKIISQVEWEGLSVTILERAAKSVHAAKAIRQKYSKHVMNRLRLLIVSDDEEGNDRRARIMSYLNQILKFFRAPEALTFKQTKKKEVESKEGGEANSKNYTKETVMTTNDTATISRELRIPEYTIEKFVEKYAHLEPSKRFGEGPQYHRSRKEKDLLIATILVLSLTIDDFRSVIDDIADDLKMSCRELVPYYRELGCKIVKLKQSEEGTHSATLLLPLTFPDIKMRRKQAAKSM